MCQTNSVPDPSLSKYKQVWTKSTFTSGYFTKDRNCGAEYHFPLVNNGVESCFRGQKLSHVFLKKQKAFPLITGIREFVAVHNKSNGYPR